MLKVEDFLNILPIFTYTYFLMNYIETDDVFNRTGKIAKILKNYHQKYYGNLLTH